MSTLSVVNSPLQFPQVSLISPSSHYYVQMAAKIDSHLLPVVLLTSAQKKRLLRACKLHCQELRGQDGVISAVVFQAIIFPPGKGKYLEESARNVHIANFDVAVLIEVKDLKVLEQLTDQSSYIAIHNALSSVAKDLHVMTARNAKQINPVDHLHQGVFLFNYFFAENVQQNLAVWEYTAGWFQQETRLDNSTVLIPLTSAASDYAIINHCRWDHLKDILPALIFKKSFSSYVLANFYANQVAAMPILYKLA